MDHDHDGVVREQRYTVCKPVWQEYHVPVRWTTCRPVYEQHVQQVPYTVYHTCYQPYQVPYRWCTYKPEYETHVRNIPYCTYRQCVQTYEVPVRFSQLAREVESKPDDPDLNARMAYEHLARRDYKEARPFAEKALKLKPHHPLASYVKARLLVTIGDSGEALTILEEALDPEKPAERAIDLLAELRVKAGRLDEPAKLDAFASKEPPL